MNVTALTENGFAAWLQEGDGIVLFHRERCPHCKIMHTVLEKAQGMEPALRVATVDIEKEPALKEAQGVERVPTLLFCKGGAVAARKNGIMKPAELLQAYEQA